MGGKIACGYLLLAAPYLRIYTAALRAIFGRNQRLPSHG